MTTVSSQLFAATVILCLQGLEEIKKSDLFYKIGMLAILKSIIKSECYYYSSMSKKIRNINILVIFDPTQ